MLFAAACDSGSALDVEEEAAESLRLTGALNTGFEPAEGEIVSWANVTTQEGYKYLALTMQAQIREGDSREQVHLTFRIPFEGDFPEPGTYRLGEGEELIAQVTYRNENNPRSFARYRFDGLALDLILEQASRDQLTGRFALRVQQRFGERAIDGQLVEVELSRSGEMRAEAVFSTTQVDVR